MTCGHGFGCMHPKQRWRCCTLHQWFVTCALGVLWARGAGAGDCANMGVGKSGPVDPASVACIRSNGGAVARYTSGCDLRARCVVGTRCGGWEIVRTWAWGKRVPAVTAFGCMHPKQRWRCCTLPQWFVTCALGVLWARGAGAGRLCEHGRGEVGSCGPGFGCMHPKQRWRCPIFRTTKHRQLINPCLV